MRVHQCGVYPAHRTPAGAARRRARVLAAGLVLT